MSSNQVAKLACRIMAVWLFAQAAMGIEGCFAGLVVILVGPNRGFGFSDLVAGSGLETVMFGLIGALLWLGAGKIASRVSAEAPEPIAGSDITARTGMEIACSAVGLFLFVDVVGSFSFEIVNASRSYFHGSAAYSVNSNRIIGDFVRLAFALWLIFGSRGIARLIHWVRTAGDKSGMNDVAEPGKSAEPR